MPKILDFSSLSKFRVFQDQFTAEEQVAVDKIKERIKVNMAVAKNAGATGKEIVADLVEQLARIYYLAWLYDQACDQMVTTGEVPWRTAAYK